MKETKWMVWDQRKDGNGDVFTKYFASKEEAMKVAHYDWSYLTKKEQSEREILVGLTEVDEDGETIDGSLYDIWSTEEELK